MPAETGTSIGSRMARGRSTTTADGTRPTDSPLIARQRPTGRRPREPGRRIAARSTSSIAIPTRAAKARNEPATTALTSAAAAPVVPAATAGAARGAAAAGAAAAGEGASSRGGATRSRHRVCGGQHGRYGRRVAQRHVGQPDRIGHRTDRIARRPIHAREGSALECSETVRSS